jgi:hypothetical protein
MEIYGCKPVKQIGVMLALTSAVINVAWSGLMAGTGEAASLGQAGMGIAGLYMLLLIQ